MGMEIETEMQENDNWKPKVLIAGTVLGALLGLGSAFLLSRTAEENRGGPPQITTGDALRLGVGIFGLMRGIASLGD